MGSLCSCAPQDGKHVLEGDAPDVGSRLVAVRIGHAFPGVEIFREFPRVFGNSPQHFLHLFHCVEEIDPKQLFVKRKLIQNLSFCRENTENGRFAGGW